MLGRRHRLGLPLVLALCACGSKQPQPPPDWVASIETLSGQVQVNEAAGAAVTEGKKGLLLRVGGRLETGAKSHATLVLRNGGRLTIKPDSVVSFGSSLPARNLALALERGSVEGKSGDVEASELVIGVGERKVRLTAAAAATVSAKGEADPKVFVSFGAATVEDPDGKKQKLVEGKELVLSSPRVAPKPDAGAAPAKPDAGTVTAPEIVYYLRASGKGRVMIRRPGETRFTLVRKGEPVKITPGTELKLTGKATVMVGSDAAGGGTSVTGPAQLVVQEGPKSEDGKPAPRIESTGGEMQVALVGRRGKAGAPFTVEGVKITTRVSYRRLDVKLRKEKGRAVLVLGAGEATLTGKDRTLRLEAGQEAVLSKGRITGPNMPPSAPLEIRSGGTMRVFASAPAIPVTFRWGPEGKAHLVEVSRSASYANPIFSDIIQRRALTTTVGKGTVFWQVKPVDGSGSATGKGAQGKLILLRDTSHRVLKGQAPKNTIQESFGNTTVYYQNVLPRFTFRWEPMGPGASYQLKVFREQSLSKPILVVETKNTSLALAPGKLTEGTFIWYVVGRGGTTTRTPQGHRLSIKYDNATPDLQIIYPPNGATVGADLEAKGVAIPGSKVSINGQPATLDDTFRFSHPVKLRSGVNQIIFLVVDPRRGASYYLRQVTRR